MHRFYAQRHVLGAQLHRRVARPSSPALATQNMELFGPNNSTISNIWHLLGNFGENHDNMRQLCELDDMRMFQ